MAKVSNLISPLGLEALDRPDQADQPVGDQVGLLDVRGQAGADAAGDELDQRRVGDDQPLAGALVALVLVAAPELPQLDRLYLRFHEPFTCTSGDLSLRPADDFERTGFAARMARLGCRPAWSRGSAWPSSSWIERRSAPALQQVGRERVSQRVRRDAAGDRRLAHPALQAPAHVGGMKPPAALRDEQRRSRRRRRRARGGRARGSGCRARWAGSPIGTRRFLPPLPSTRSRSPRSRASRGRG